jgi:hypothetical protein
MKRTPCSPPLLQRLALALATALGLAGCASMDVNKETVQKTDQARVGPQELPFRSITGFSSALRCMDSQFVDYGVRDISMLVEDILDNTKKVNAGTRDMLITAVSDMTRRSRGVKVVAFGKDASNVISFLATAQRQSAYEVIPQFDIKGSVSQFDENVIRNQKDFGVGFSPFVNLGIARDAASSVLGLDLSVLGTEDMAILPGVTSRNSVVILKSGKGADADAAYHKFGINFSMTLSKSEGQSQALRGLVELAAVELMGKLTKTPYWRCLGASYENSEEVKREVSDWYFAMSGSQVELIAWFQNQLRTRGFYDGPVDGKFNPAVDEAIGNYREALGLERRALLDEAFFKAFLAADHSSVKRPARPAVYVAEGSKPAAAAAPAAAPLQLLLASNTRGNKFARGEAITLLLKPSQDAHVYCYLQDEAQKIRRFFPNRFARDSLVPSAQAMQLPGPMRFQLVMNDKGVNETVMCFATPRDVMQQLPPNAVGVDFEALPVASLDQLRDAFKQASGGLLAQEVFHVQPK